MHVFKSIRSSISRLALVLLLAGALPQVGLAQPMPAQPGGGMMMNCPMMQGHAQRPMQGPMQGQRGQPQGPMQGQMQGQMQAMMQMMQGMMQMMQTMQAQMQPGQTQPAPGGATESHQH
jgi:hypothetical protein